MFYGFYLGIGIIIIVLLEVCVLSYLSYNIGNSGDGSEQQR